MKERIVYITADNSGGVTDQTILSAHMIKKNRDVKIIKVNTELKKIDTKGLKKSDIIYLQYSGYGFAKRGAPTWLIKETVLLKKKVKKIIILFHELYAHSYYPWKSAFWLHLVQKLIVNRLAKNADIAITTCKGYLDKLKKLELKNKPICLNAFSNVGELKKINYKKNNILVVFGLSRVSVYSKIGNKLFIWAKKNNIKIIDIGPKLNNSKIVINLNFHNVKIVGKLNISDIKKIFKKAKFGLMMEDVNYVDKSSVFNAYLSYGIMPIVLNTKKKITITHKDLKFHSSLPANIKSNKKHIKDNWLWYNRHNLINYTNKLENIFNNSENIN